MTTDAPPHVAGFWGRSGLKPGDPNYHVAEAAASIDKLGDTWRAVVAYAHAEIENNRTLLETPGLEQRRGDELRGANAALRKIISIGDDYQHKPIDRRGLPHIDG